MLKSLKYNVTFEKTGRSLGADLNFKKGLTAITGANESGKSMIVEVIRWCLFGSDALRGSADDYTTLSGTLVVGIRGEDYTIERTLRGGKVKKGDTLLATGTRPINQKVIELLGYDLQVFDIANAANQDQLGQLAQMRPADRKRMVDRVIGADQIEELTKWCGDEANLVGREVSTLEKRLVEPGAPAEPEGYEPSSKLESSVQSLREAMRELHQLQGWLANPPGEPEVPVAPTHGLTAEVIAEGERLLGVHVYGFDVEAVEKEWAAYKLWQERLTFEKRNPRPTVSAEQVEQAERRWMLESELKQLRKNPILTCPCGKPFTTADARIREIEVELSSLPETDFDFRGEAKLLAIWNHPSTQEAWGRLKDAQETPEPTVSEYAVTLAQRPDSMFLLDWRARLTILGLTGETLQSLRAKDNELRRYEALKAAYEPQKQTFDAWMEKAVEVRQQVSDLQGLDGRLASAEKALRAALTYEVDLTTYQKAKGAYDADVAALEVSRRAQTSWQESRAALNSLREKIKTHLVPSLSRSASSLLSHLTGGARNQIVVDENFEVMVDGQPLATLSGSGQACSNLALRIGLGQVLTNNVLSVFMGDELDASMDEQRAENFRTSTRMLKDYISQIIIITHKSPEADHVVTLGG